MPSDQQEKHDDPRAGESRKKQRMTPTEFKKLFVKRVISVYWVVKQAELKMLLEKFKESQQILLAEKDQILAEKEKLLESMKEEKLRMELELELLRAQLADSESR